MLSWLTTPWTVVKLKRLVAANARDVRRERNKIRAVEVIAKRFNELHAENDVLSAEVARLRRENEELRGKARLGVGNAAG